MTLLTMASDRGWFAAQFSVRRAGFLAMLMLALSAPQTYAASCMINEAPGATLVEFPPYASGGPAVDGLGQIDLSCTPDGLVPVSYSVQIGPGSGSYAQRLLTGTLDDLPYNLYRDPTRVLLFDENAVPGLCAGFCPILVYGRLDGGSFVAPGEYTDTVTVTIEF